MAATASQSNLAGLPRRLVQDGIVSEDQLQEAVESAKKERLPLIAYLVNEEIANARAIAVAASHEFGVPLLDLDSLEVDLEVVRAVDQNLITKHRVLPLVKRGQRIFLGIADPTNLQAIDDIKFATSLRVDPVVVEQDKLEERINRAIEAVDTSMGGLEDAETNAPCVTAEMQLAYRRPVLIADEVIARARLTGVDGRDLHVEGAIVATDGTVLTGATSRWRQLRKVPQP